MSNSSEHVNALRSFSSAIADLVELCLPRTCTVLVRSANLLGAGNGSGWCYSSNHVVTNHHVVDDANGIVNVRFPGQTPKKGRVLGSDPQTDLAVIEIESSHVPPLELRTDPAVRTGEICLTMGAPDGLEESVSMGIVSALHRQIDTGSIKFEEAIQVDAAVNPGNSGGPLLDCGGNVIGVNFLKRLGAGAQHGNPLTQISFAIPSEVVTDIVPELIEHGTILRGSLGVSISQIMLETPDGVMPAVQIQKVTEHSPLRPGDVITACQGTSISRRYDLMRLLNRDSVGRATELQIIRDGASMAIEVTPTARPESV